MLYIDLSTEDRYQSPTIRATLQKKNFNSWWFSRGFKNPNYTKKSKLIIKIEVHYELPYPARGV